MQNFNSQQHFLDEDLVVLLPPSVDEFTDFSHLQPRLSQLIVWDCSQIERVNSIGLQRWIECFRRLDSRQQYIFRKVPRRVVETFSNVIDFLPPYSRIESFYFPLECVSCEHEEHELLRRGKDYLEAQGKNTAAVARPPLQLNCPKCQGMMESAVQTNIYLRFLNYRDATSES